MLGTSQEQSKARIAHDVCAVLCARDPLTRTRAPPARPTSSRTEPVCNIATSVEFLLPRHFQMRARNRSHQPTMGSLRRSSIALALRFWRTPPGLISPNLWVPLDRGSAPCASPQRSRPFGSRDAKMTDSQGEVYSCLSQRYTTTSRRWGPPLTAHFGLIAPASQRGHAHYAGETDAPGSGEESGAPHLRERSGAEGAGPVTPTCVQNATTAN